MTLRQAGVGPGVAPEATSSAKWQRLLGRAGSGSAAPAHPGTTLTIVVGASDPALTRELEHREAPLLQLEELDSPAATRRIDDALAAARTGWRFRVVGAEASLGALRARLHGAGVLDEEIELLAVPEVDALEAVRVYCGHCHATTAARRGPLAVDSERLPCSGCGAPLTVAPHFSRRQGAYLGYVAEAEGHPADCAPAVPRDEERRGVAA